MPSLARDQLASRYSIVLKPEEFMPIVRLIQTWTTCSGEEWAVRRLKDIRQMALHHFLRLPYQPSERVAHVEGVCKGPFRVLFMHGRSAFIRRWNACMAYTGFVSARITERQFAKFMKGVERPPVRREALARAKGFMELGFQQLADRHWPKPPPPLGEEVSRYPARAGKRKSVDISGSIPETEALFPSVQQALRNAGFLSRFPNIALGTLGNYGFNPTSTKKRAIVGSISIIQEPGYKARIIANPNLVYQQMFRPLYKWLRKVNASLPGNFQFAQGEGLKLTLSRVQQGKTCVSLDASGWTDHFPRALSAYGMELFDVDPEWLEAFEAICASDWRLPRLGLKRMPETDVFPSRFSSGFAAWTVGQPLGLLPTFNAASLAHVLLALGIQTRCLERNEDLPAYAIVGDDIVWFDKECARVYLEVLEGLGVPVALDKSLESSRAAEFCSRLIDRKAIIYAPKWKLASDDSFIEAVRPLGPRGMRLLRKEQRKVVKFIAPLPEPYGLGWNREGKPLWERMQILEQMRSHPGREIRLKSLELRALELHYLSGGYPEVIASDSSSELSTDQVDIHSAPMPFKDMDDYLRNLVVSEVMNWSEVLSDEYSFTGRVSSETLGNLPKYLRDYVEGKDAAKCVADLAGWLTSALELMEEADKPVHETTLRRLQRVIRKLKVDK